MWGGAGQRLGRGAGGGGAAPSERSAAAAPVGRWVPARPAGPGVSSPPTTVERPARRAQTRPAFPFPARPSKCAPAGPRPAPFWAEESGWGSARGPGSPHSSPRVASSACGRRGAEPAPPAPRTLPLQLIQMVLKPEVQRARGPGPHSNPRGCGAVRERCERERPAGTRGGNSLGDAPIFEFSLHFGWEVAVSLIALSRLLNGVRVNIDGVGRAAREVGGRGEKGRRARGALSRARSQGVKGRCPAIPHISEPWARRGSAELGSWRGLWGRGGSAKVSASPGSAGGDPKCPSRSRVTPAVSRSTAGSRSAAENLPPCKRSATVRTSGPNLTLSAGGCGRAGGSVPLAAS